MRINATTEHLYFTPGFRGDGATAFQPAGQYGVKRSSDGGATWSDLPTIKAVGPLGVGAPMPGSTSPTLFGYGFVGSTIGLYRSTDLGTSWTFLVDSPLGWRQGCSALAGDPEVPGRVYFGMGGGSFFRGDTA